MTKNCTTEGKGKGKKRTRRKKGLEINKTMVAHSLCIGDFI